MRRPCLSTGILNNYNLPPKSRCRPTGGQPVCGKETGDLSKELPFPHPRMVFVFAGTGSLSRPRFLRRREVLKGTPSPLRIAAGGMGADPLRRRGVRDPVGRISAWVSVCLACRVCLSPRFYPHSVRPESRLLDGVPRFGGALLSLRRSRLDQDVERSQPHSDGYALPRCQTLPPFSIPRCSPIVLRRYCPLAVAQ
jgi:hypothetical protein